MAHGIFNKIKFRQDHSQQIYPVRHNISIQSFIQIRFKINKIFLYRVKFRFKIINHKFQECQFKRKS